MTFSTILLQTFSISTALVAAGGIAALSLFDVPELQSQPASRSLPMIRWLFSRGSHIFPSASVASATGFAILAYQHIQPNKLSSLQLLIQTTPDLKFTGFLAASLLSFSIAPWTAIVMIPNNFAIIERNEKLGGTRSAASAESFKSKGQTLGHRTAQESVDGKGEGIGEFTDLSVPQTETEEKATGSEDEEVREMLGKFGRQNMARAVLMAGGGVVGLLAALV